MAILHTIAMILFILAMFAPMLFVAYECIYLDIMEEREEKRKNANKCRF